MLLLALASTPAADALGTPHWEPAPGLDECSPPSTSCTGRLGHATTLLSNGKVLVVGGTNNRPDSGPALNTAQLYDPGEGVWLPTASPLHPAPKLHTLTALPAARALLVPADGPAEVYDSACETWTEVGPPPRSHGQHTATALKDGRVLVAGGLGGAGKTGTNAVDIFDPVENRWTATNSMIQLRYQHAATVLPDGKVLVVGGYSDNYGPKRNSAEIYNPANGTWAPTASLSEDYTPIDPTATLLVDGRVLVAGGESRPTGTASGIGGDRKAELYDPATGTWTPTGGPNAGRSLHTATLLPDGKVLAVGGTVTIAIARPEAEQPPQSSVEIYDPGTGTWTFGPKPHLPRSAHTATALPDGRVLVVGGRTLASTEVVATETLAEIYNSEVASSLPVDKAAGAGACRKPTASSPGAKGAKDSSIPIAIVASGVIVVGGTGLVIWRRRRGSKPQPS